MQLVRQPRDLDPTFSLQALDSNRVDVAPRSNVVGEDHQLDRLGLHQLDLGIISFVDLLRWLEVFTGLVMNLITFYDLFKSVVLPRPAINKFILVRSLFFTLWNFWLWANDRQSPNRREGWLATFGPVAVLLMFATWALIFVFGYAF